MSFLAPPAATRRFRQRRTAAENGFAFIRRDSRLSNICRVTLSPASLDFFTTTTSSTTGVVDAAVGRFGALAAAARFAAAAAATGSASEIDAPENAALPPLFFGDFPRALRLLKL